MIDPQSVSEPTNYRWPLILFFAPVGALFLAAIDPMSASLATLTVGIIFVFGALWSIWFSGMWKSSANLVEATLIGRLSTVFLGTASGAVLVAGWYFALDDLFTISQKENNVLSTQSVKNLLIITTLNALVGMILFYYSGRLVDRWHPKVLEVSLWSPSEGRWLLTSLGLSVFYSVIAFLVV